MKNLKIFDTYTRREVYEIFDGITPFTPGAGTWGIHGIVKIPNRKKDYVLFVTFGQKGFGLEFKESLTVDGILKWQSQPKQTIQNKQIQDFINHDYLKSNIYLFLRCRKNSKSGIEPFTYLGRLAYLNHDINLEKPVHINWQIIDWEVPNEHVLNRIGLTLTLEVEDEKYAIAEDSEEYNYRTRKGRIDYVAQNKRNRELGLQGELFVFQLLKKELVQAKKPELAEKMIHVSIVEGDSAGFDILTFDLKGNPIYVEVKTTTGGKHSRFFISSNELAFCESNPEKYRLVRVYNFNPNTENGDIRIYNGMELNNFTMEPVNYQVKF